MANDLKDETQPILSPGVWAARNTFFWLNKHSLIDKRINICYLGGKDRLFLKTLSDLITNQSSLPDTNVSVYIFNHNFQSDAEVNLNYPLLHVRKVETDITKTLLEEYPLFHFVVSTYAEWYDDLESDWQVGLKNALKMTVCKGFFIFCEEKKNVPKGLFAAIKNCSDLKFHSIYNSYELKHLLKSNYANKILDRKDVEMTNSLYSFFKCKVLQINSTSPWLDDFTLPLKEELGYFNKIPT